jgi:hypothetical protein
MCALFFVEMGMSLFSTAVRWARWSPAAAAALSCVLPSMSFPRNNLTCASLTMEPHLAPRGFRAARTATTGKSNCRGSFDDIDEIAAAQNWVLRNHTGAHLLDFLIHLCELLWSFLEDLASFIRQVAE